MKQKKCVSIVKWYYFESMYGIPSRGVSHPLQHSTAAPPPSLALSVRNIQRDGLVKG